MVILNDFVIGKSFNVAYCYGDRIYKHIFWKVSSEFGFRYAIVYYNSLKKFLLKEGSVM